MDPLKRMQQQQLPFRPKRRLELDAFSMNKKNCFEEDTQSPLMEFADEILMIILTCACAQDPICQQEEDAPDEDSPCDDYDSELFFDEDENDHLIEVESSSSLSLPPVLNKKNNFLAIRAVNRRFLRLTKDERFIIPNLNMKNDFIISQYIVRRPEKDQTPTNLFLTGPAGCGKTFTIKAICKAAEKHGRKYALTSTTGLSSTQFKEKACTIHSFSKLGLNKITPKQLEDEFAKGKIRGKLNWKSIDLLIIDEVSMLPDTLLDKMNMCAMAARNDPRPMGGIQVVFSGDFFQLCPVGAKMPFQSSVWSKMRFHVELLETPVRQCRDRQYFDMLNRVRKNRVLPEDLELLNSRVRTKQIFDMQDEKGVKPTRIFTYNKEVEEMNQIEFSKVESPVEFTSLALDQVYYRLGPTGKYVLDTHANLNKVLEKLGARVARTAPEKLEFKVGAQYILTFNLDVRAGLVNGARCVHVGGSNFRFVNGRVVTIYDHTFIFPIDSNRYLRREQMPLRLGYAITIHGSQGMTLDSAIVSLSGPRMQSGQVYVALSRVKNLESLYLFDFDPKKIKASKTVVDFYEGAFNRPTTTTQLSLDGGRLPLALNKRKRQEEEEEEKREKKQKNTNVIVID